MTCKDFVERLDVYLDHRLARDEQCSVDGHLHDCKACRRLAGAYQERQVVLRTAVTDVVAAVDLSGLWGAVHHAIEHDAPVSRIAGWRLIMSRVRRYVAQRTMPVPASFTPLRLTAWAAAAAAVVIVVFSLGGPGGPGAARVQVAEQTSPAAPVLHPRAHIRNVRIDSLEAAEGHTVATWTQTHTGAQVIWVADADAIPGR